MYTKLCLTQNSCVKKKVHSIFFFFFLILNSQKYYGLKYKYKKIYCINLSTYLNILSLLDYDA